MKRQRRVHPKADAELEAAADWYGARSVGLAEEFLGQIGDAIAAISDWPFASPEFPGWDELPLVRSRALRSFPFRVVYYTTEDRVTVLAYAHIKREPSYWRARYADRF
ncbi:type II toxin-antitoxin system RelE/ParE family toxin [Leucobacter insecticola]|uniref:Type II toxin-antitoxin system RelE/ParE family toxin n=1 Tax=Leucobacter insecticola TaxID=2714934 RepID=A0A6G8FI05_9MICO|nr:type II toxin-antitoxin system RelE/ParE family toxin [Leucobacter insecticola]QIM15978.1 type II toxin-antitoxin system RelE/ParE family toxin [Leucobacter insecticola]